MATYRVFSFDLRTKTLLGELEVSGLRYGERLNSVGELSGVVSLPSPTSTANRLLAAQINDLVDEGRRRLVVDRDGVIVWTGPVWMSPYRDSPPTREIRAATMWSYFRRRVRSTRKVFTAVDQVSMAQTLITDAQAETGGNLGITVEASTSGVTKSQTYEAFEVKQIAEAIEQLAAADNGFDFAIDTAWSSTGALVDTFRTHYPRRGRSYLQTGHVFEVGRNVIDWTWPSDGARMANRVFAVGRGEGSAMLLASQSDATKIQALTSGGPGYPLLDEVLSVTDVGEKSTLNALALSRLKAVAAPVTLPEITVRADIDPVFGSYIVGDSCRFIIPPDTSPRFPNGLDTFLRIIGWDVNVGDDGDETVTLILGDEFNG